MKHVLRLIRTQLRQHVGGIALRLVLAVIVSSGPYIFSFLGKWLVDEVIQIQKKPPVEASASAAPSAPPATSKEDKTGAKGAKKSGWTLGWKSESVGDRVKLLGLFAGLSLLIHLVFTAMSGVSEYVSAHLNQRIMFRMRKQVYNKVQRLDASAFHREPMGQMMARVLDDTANIPGNLSNLVINATTQFVMLILGLFLLLRLNPTLTLYAVAALPLYGVSCFLLLPKIRRNSERIRNRVALFKGFIFERMINMLTVKNYAQEDAEVQRFNTLLDQNQSLTRQQQKLNLAFNTSTNLINSIGATAVLAVGFTYIKNGSMSLGEVLAFHQVTAHLFVPIGALVGMGAVIQSINISAERIYSIVDAKNELADGPDPLPPEIPGDIRFDAVSLKYQEDGPFAVQDLSFEIPTGKMVCVVGPTGCGKSTLIALLTRLYDPDEGTITLGGKDIRSFPVADLRRAVGNVFSTTQVFTGSLADNMALGMSDVARGQIEETGRAVGLDSFVKTLPDGYDTMVGVGGETLGREELARLSFARAILSNPKVMTVDDTFTAFSEDAEQQLRLALDLRLSGRTIIVATSRYSICEDADLILVMRKGGIVQIGSHQELMQEPGLYHRMYSRQMGLHTPTASKP